MNKLRIFFRLFLILVFLAGIYVIVKTDNTYKEQLVNRQKEADHAVENFSNYNEKETNHCPNILLQSGNKVMLYNTSIPIKEGANPIQFDNLDGYIQHLENQRKKGEVCPVLFLQKESGIQGKDIYRIRPNINNMNGEITGLISTYNPMQERMKNRDDDVDHEHENPDGNGNVDAHGNADGNGNADADRNDNDNTNKNKVVKQMDASRENPPYNQGNYTGFDPTSLYVGVYTDVDQIHDSTEKNPISDNPMDSNWGGVLYTEKQVRSGKYDENNIYKPLLYNPKVHYDVGVPNPYPPPKDIIE